MGSFSSFWFGDPDSSSESEMDSSSGSEDESQEDPTISLNESCYPGSILNNVARLSKTMPEQDYSLVEMLGFVKPGYDYGHHIPREMYTYEYKSIELPGLSEETRELYRPDEQSTEQKDDIKPNPKVPHRPDEQSEQLKDLIGSTSSSESEGYKSGEGVPDIDDAGVDIADNYKENGVYESQFVSATVGTPKLVIRKKGIKRELEETPSPEVQFLSMYDKVKRQRRSCALQENIQYYEETDETSPKKKTTKKRNKRNNGYKRKS